ncbi:MAG: dihydrofolate reductase family protein [Taibaiella sp.]|nr:dihydrofolate reductase family protein [Taibaiella sp.]
MHKLIVSEHITLDGYVAGPGGSMDWISLDDDMFDYVGAFTGTAETALYGRHTFEMMDAYWPTAGNKPNASKHDKDHSAWYNRVQKLVLSRSLAGTRRAGVSFFAENLEAEIANALQRGNVLVFGSPGAVHTLFRHDLVDEMYLFINGVTLGAGIPLFSGIPGTLRWNLVASRHFKNGVQCLHYSK